MEAARSEKDAGRLRAYVSIFEEYFTYWSVGQKEQTLDFLYEQSRNVMENAGTQAGAYVMGNSLGIFRWLIKGGAIFAIVSIGSVLMVSSMDPEGIS